jgi:alanyl-tRNA synthetase
MATRRLYYDDAFARDFSAQIVSCEPMAHGSSPAWGITLDQTALYPTSGGQPHDLGRIGGANVLDVRDEGDEILHIVDQPLESGEVQCCIDWPRRFDHMQQHTGQHLLSAVFQERFGRPTVSFHVGAELSSIDLRGPEPSDEILEGAERAANEIIFEDRPVTVRYGTAEDLAQRGVRKEVERSGILRAIEIERADLQPCGGTHVKSTGQIGTLLVRRCTKIRQDWRVEFVCGARAERAARADFLRIRAAAEKLGCSAEELASVTDRLIVDRDSHFKRASGLLQRLSELEAEEILRNIRSNSDGIRIVSRVLSAVEQEYIGFLATEVAKHERCMSLFIHGEGGDAVFAQHPSAGKDMSALLKEVLGRVGGKGGGTRDFARGRLADATRAEQALLLANELVRGAQAATQNS